MNRWRPAAGNSQTIGRNMRSVIQCHAAKAKPSGGVDDLSANNGWHGCWRGFGNIGSAVDNGGNLNAGSVQILRGCPAIIIIGENGNAFAWGNAKPIDIGSHRTGKHDTRPVIIAEGNWPFGRARCQNTSLATDMPKNLANGTLGIMFVHTFQRAIT